MPMFKKQQQTVSVGQRLYEPTQLAQRKDFWVCGSCGQEFRISKESPPVCCPKCGRTRASSMGEVAANELWAEKYICPKCEETVEMLDGAKARVCPCCGWEIRKPK